MGKWAKYEIRLCDKWEKETKLKEWIQKVSSDECKAYCMYCWAMAHRLKTSELCFAPGLRTRKKQSNSSSLIECFNYIYSNLSKQSLAYF